MKMLYAFFSDERGETSEVLKLVLATLLSMALLIALFQIMHLNQASVKNSTHTLDAGAKKGLEDTMISLSD